MIQAFRRTLRKDGLKLPTERAYVGKLKAFMHDRGLTCLADFDRITATNVEAHLTDLAVDGNVAPTTQNGAFHALLKFFELVLKRDMGRIEAIRANKGKQIPTVLSPPEVEAVLDGLEGVHLCIAQLLYGCGMRISEALRLRMKDLEFEKISVGASRTALAVSIRILASGSGSANRKFAPSSFTRRRRFHGIYVERSKRREF